VLKHHFLSVVSADLKVCRCGIPNVDFVKEYKQRARQIVSTPYGSELADDFIVKALALTAARLPCCSIWLRWHTQAGQRSGDTRRTPAHSLQPKYCERLKTCKIPLPPNAAGLGSTLRVTVVVPAVLFAEATIVVAAAAVSTSRIAASPDFVAATIVVTRLVVSITASRFRAALGIRMVVPTKAWAIPIIVVAALVNFLNGVELRIAQVVDHGQRRCHGGTGDQNGRCKDDYNRRY